ncbi:glycine-rich domain-containing protein [Halopseudomonas oceani]|uniref:glycine-rich domain-containing protein n=1 Tax=Halopseudomonas oceani TaxID=1708783 RepID=UPI002AA86BCB|nr:hypothetical protein [Halopseudomonas oceani]
MIRGVIASAIKRAIGNPVLVATGGVVTDRVIDYTPYRIHTFTESDTFTVESNSAEVEYLIVGGGGGGGRTNTGGGGGAGVIRTGSLIIGPGTYAVTVGAGGARADYLYGYNGGNSSAFGVTALGGGGGGGGGSGNNPDYAGCDGGNGGGGGGSYRGISQPGGTGSPGNNGGFGYETLGTGGRRGGGGGSMVEAGQDGYAASRAGCGGEGLRVNIDGGRHYFASGGCGGTNGSSLSRVQVGGGGDGARDSRGARSGNANSGGGGGGASDSYRTPGAGGSGIVILRYRTGKPGSAVDPLLPFVTSLITAEGAVGTDTITDFRGGPWEPVAAGAVSVIESGIFPNGQAIAVPGGDANCFAADFDLSAGDFCIELEIAFTAWAGGGYAAPLLQYGTDDEGEDGFGVSVYSPTYISTDQRKLLTIRNGYHNTASVAFDAKLGDAVHLAIHYIGGQLYVSANDSAWSVPLAGFSMPSGAKPLQIGNLTGTWLQAREFHLGSGRITQAATRYAAPYAPPPLPYPTV